MNYHNITKDDMLNGNGLRVVLWTAGCTHKCEGCHNKVTWDACGGVRFDESAKEELFQELRKDYVSGITFSGGDPMHDANVDTIVELAREIRKEFPKKNIWVYSGYKLEQIINKAPIKTEEFEVNGKILVIRDMLNDLPAHEGMEARKQLLLLTDVFVDGKFEQSKTENKKNWVGSSNQNVWKIN